MTDKQVIVLSVFCMFLAFAFGFYAGQQTQKVFGDCTVMQCVQPTQESLPAFGPVGD